MKKIMFAFFPWFFAAFSYKAFAQDDVFRKDDDKQAEEIIIRKKGGKDVNINIQITGDKVMINGKPLIEFKDDQITINKRKMFVRDGNNIHLGDMGDLGEIFNDDKMNWNEPGAASGAFLGVTTEKADDGARISQDVTKESAAGKAGLEKGDIITKLGDKKIDGPESLYEAVIANNPKDEVKISYKRKGKEKKTKAILQERKASFTKSYSYSGPDGSYKTFTMPALPRAPRPPRAIAPPQTWNEEGNGFIAPEMQQELDRLDELKNFNFDMKFLTGREKLGLKIQDTEDEKGVRVLEVEDSSAAAKSGLKKDDVITEIGGQKVNNTDEAREQLMENRDKSTYNIKARRAGRELSFDIKIPKKLKTADL